MVQRWRISSNSQPLLLRTLTHVGCLWWFKDEEFQAIHNVFSLSAWFFLVFMMVQRWRISSNSQHFWFLAPLSLGCLWWFKDEEFQAIHNVGLGFCERGMGVYDGSKMKNFKQFTTTFSRAITSAMVFMMVQRWRISSNSQPLWLLRKMTKRCLWWFKDEEFQAIHNYIYTGKPAFTGVYDGSKMKNFKQFIAQNVKELRLSKGRRKSTQNYKDDERKREKNDEDKGKESFFGVFTRMMWCR